MGYPVESLETTKRQKPKSKMQDISLETLRFREGFKNSWLQDCATQNRLKMENCNSENSQGVRLNLSQGVRETATYKLEASLAGWLRDIASSLWHWRMLIHI